MASFDRKPASRRAPVPALRLQRKARLGDAASPHEREADAMAERVMRGQGGAAPVSGLAPAGVQRACASCGEDDAAQVQAQRESTGDGGGAGPAASGVDAAVRAADGGGAPLPAPVRSFFEPRFGRDFSAVRVHADGRAATAAKAIQARAYTVGRDVVFGQGEYAPGSVEGRRLLAHELTHVVQQRAAGDAALQRKEAPGATGGGAPPATERLAGTLWAQGPDGKNLPPSIEDIAQGGVNDCFLFAAMGAIVHNDPQSIVRMIKDNGNGTYTVTFKGIGFFSSATQTVNADFVVGKHGNVKARSALWPLIIEKAYAQQKGGLANLDKGGNAGNAADDMLDDGPSRFDPREETASYLMGKLVKAKEKKWPVTINSPKREGSGTDKKALADGTPGLHFWHAYVVVDIDAEHARIKLFNPWGNDHPNGDGWMDVEKVRKFFVEVDIID